MTKYGLVVLFGTYGLSFLHLDPNLIYICIHFHHILCHLSNIILLFFPLLFSPAFTSLFLVLHTKHHQYYQQLNP
jgi:hypothetical protein